MSITMLATRYIMEHDEYYQDAVSMARRNGIRDFAQWLETRSPTLRAAVEPDTAEALVEEIVRRAKNLAQYSEVDVNNFRRFLRERLARS